MARVEWAALEGGEVETVLANLLYNWNGRAQRIRPTQGDFGIDVIIPATDGAEPWDVYQIKKYATNLTSGQKSKIVESFARMIIGVVRESLPIRNWYLAMPLDPTMNNLREWFSGLPEAAIEFATKLGKNSLTIDEVVRAHEWLQADGRKIEWKGLNFCESLAADYPRVIDYYLHDGSERLREAVASMAMLIAGNMQVSEKSHARAGSGAAAVMEPAEVVSTLTALAEVLDTDPHYTYEYIVGPTRPILLQPEPNLVAAQQQCLPNGHYLTFKIYQRSSQSQEERPIPFSVSFKFESGSPEHEAFETWQHYGKPFEAAAAFKIDLPGGLGGESDDGWVSVSIPPGPTYKLRMQIVGPDDKVLAAIALNMHSTVSADGKGFWVSGHDPSGVLTHEGFYDGSSRDTIQRVNFSLAPLAGVVAAEVQPAVQFARHLQAPNRIQVSGPVGRFMNLLQADGVDGLVPPAVDDFVKALAIIQSRTDHVIHIPDFTRITAAELRKIQRAADILGGGTRVATWEDIEIEGVDNGTLEQGGHYQLQVETRLTVAIEGVELELGGVEQTVLSATVDRVAGKSVRLIPNLNKTVHERFINVANRGDAPAGMTTVRGRPYPAPLTSGEEENRSTIPDS